MRAPQNPERTEESSASAARRGLKRRLILTRAGMVCERGVRAFWPVWTVAFCGLATLMTGVQDHVSPMTLRISAAIGLFALLWFVISGIRQFRLPTPGDARARLDETMPGRPLAALADTQAVGARDDASRAVWRAHQARMSAAARAARVPPPDLRISERDPHALRYAALLFLAVALLFGSVWRVGDLSAISPERRSAAASGPVWEGWIEPPAHTGLPGLYLNDQAPGILTVAQGSRFILRLYAPNDALTVWQSVSDQPPDTDTGAADTGAAEQTFIAHRDGALGIRGEGGAEWRIVLIPDEPPTIALTDDMEVSVSGEFRQAFRSTDDYGITGGVARIALDLPSVNRRHGLKADPDTREAVTLDLPLTISGDRRAFDETLIDNLSKHPWAGLPVILRLQVFDAAGQTAGTEAVQVTLPGRRFFDRTARAVVEIRRDLLWSRANAPRAALILRAISHRPGDVFEAASPYLMLRTALRRLEAAQAGALGADVQEEVAEALWQIALNIEDGDVGDALDRVLRAQERLRQAMRDGASDDEIAELMRELRNAVRDYMRRLAQNPQSTPDEPGQGERRMLSGQDLREMMDRIQQLIQQGRFAEAEELMRQFRQVMENLRVTDSPGPGGQGAGEQALEDLSGILREQQGLSDEAFRDLQEQFNSGPLAGQSQGNTGRSGGEGRGQNHDGQGSGTEGDDGSGRNDAQRGQDAPPNGGDRGGGLADRQQALREELRRGERGLLAPGASPEGDAAREAMERAGRAMEGAEQALRENDLPGALDDQAQAMEALREGMRQLSEALARNRQRGQGGAGGQARGERFDPLGRQSPGRGAPNTNDPLLQGEDVYRRARELLDSLRERSSDQERSRRELEYLKRLLDRF